MAESNWPFRDITAKDIARFAAEGRWSLVAHASAMAQGGASSRSAGSGDVVVSEWPFVDLTPRDIGVMAHEGRWGEVGRAASMALGCDLEEDDSTSDSGDNPHDHGADDSEDVPDDGDGWVGERGASVVASWPFPDLSPDDLREMAVRGDWDGVARAARMASAARVAEGDVEKLEEEYGTDLDDDGEAGEPKDHRWIVQDAMDDDEDPWTDSDDVPGGHRA